MKRSGWRALALSLLLLFVQQLALVHAFAHVAGDLQQTDSSGEAGDCPECLVLGGLQPATPSLRLALPAPLAGEQPVGRLDSLCGRSTPAAYAIRAPPAAQA